MPVTAQNLRAYLSRDWAGARASKDRALGAFVRAKGAAAAFRLGQALLDQVWPRAREVGSLDEVIAPSALRPALIEAVEAGLAQSEIKAFEAAAGRGG